jgi:phytoene dehydrogenase-like protein
MAEGDGSVIGDGPNGLLPPAYLSKAGPKILLLEIYNALGGSCSFFQDFKHDFVRPISNIEFSHSPDRGKGMKIGIPGTIQRRD